MLIIKIFSFVCVLIILFVIFCGIMSVITRRKGEGKLSEKWGTIGTHTFTGLIIALFFIWCISSMYLCIMILDGQIILS